VTGRLLVATTNTGKQLEFRRLLAHLPAEIVTPSEIGLQLDVAEPHDTYAANASAKAVAFCQASGLLTVADDSGIGVAELDWGPGVRSARWGAGSGSKAEQLFERLRGATDRRARVACALAVSRPGDPEPIVEIFEGQVEGTVAEKPRGTGGFGYDPIFLLPTGLTTAELPEAEKDRISHRGRAVATATPRLVELLAD
jgi:XTP/dITP diphosphohydrolase